MQNIKDLTVEQKEKIVEQINTEVMSIADEEKRLGRPIEVPKGEDLVQKAAASFIIQRKVANNLMLNMSKRSLIRAVNAILDLPTQDLPVLLKKDEEKQLFAAGQRIITDRYIILTHHIKKLVEEQKQKESTNESN
jgi:hypothetical protein